MIRNRLTLVGVAVLSVAIASGCAKPPQGDIDGLKAALSEADRAEAAKYAADAWTKAQGAMNAVNAELDAQANKFALFRSYTKTKELITAAQSAAAEAKQAAIAGKEAARNAAGEAVAAAKAALDSANAMLDELSKCRRQPKDFKKDLEAFRATLDGIAAQVAGLDGRVTAEDFFGAKAAAESAKASLDMLLADMQAGKEKLRC